MPGKLAALVRAKYPGAYDDMDDATLEAAVLAKYPQYADLAKDDAPAPRADIGVVSKHEPGDYWSGFRQSVGDTLSATASGVASGVLKMLNPATYLEPEPDYDRVMQQVKQDQRAIDSGALTPASALSGVAHSGAQAAKGLSDPKTGGEVIGELGTMLAAPRVLPKVAQIPARSVASGSLRFLGDVVGRPMYTARRVLRGAADMIGETPRPAPPPPPPDLGSPNATWTQRPGPPPGPRPASPTPAPGSPAGPTETTPGATNPSGSGLTPAERAALARQGYDEATIARIEQADQGQGAAGTLRMAAPPAPAPVTEPPAPAPSSFREQLEASARARGVTPAAEPPSPLTQPRVDIGAEKVARQAGKTLEDVRRETGPVLGEAAGEASPILPEKALQKIIDALRKLPPGGPEREAYVARATSGKAQWQIENIRRTLEHLGLLVPVAAGAGTVLRDKVRERLQQ